MKYTFLLPAYKIIYFKEALESILNQTYTDFKLIIQDDCSPYDLKSVVDKFKDPRIIYYRNEKNIGGDSLVMCWNKLLGKACSEYVILASDDDVYKPNFLEEVNKLILKYPEIDLIRGRVANINEHGIIFKSEDCAYKELLNYNEFVEFLYLTNNIKCISNYVFKRKSLGKNGFIDFPLAWYSDTATVLNLSRNSVCMIRDIVFLFRLSGANISSSNILPHTAYKKCIATISYNKWFKKGVLNEYTNKKKDKIVMAHNSDIKKMIEGNFFYCKKLYRFKLFILLIKNHINVYNIIYKAVILLISGFKQRLLISFYSKRI